MFIQLFKANATSRQLPETCSCRTALLQRAITSAALRRTQQLHAAVLPRLMFRPLFETYTTIIPDKRIEYSFGGRTGIVAAKHVEASR